jgi:UDP-2,3-diacylglucosamine hydrolase
VDAVFLSDIHLRSLEERNGQTLLRFLNSLEAQTGPAPAIFLLGDIFDLWVSKHKVFVRRYDALLQTLARLKAKGSRIIFFEGNHDLHLAPYWEKVLGAEVYVSASIFSVGGLRIRCEHGDEINREDEAYLKLRAFLRHPVTAFFGHTIPGGFWDYVGNKASHQSRKRSSIQREDSEEKLRLLIRAHGERVWEEDPFDAIVSGHLHIRDDWIFQKNGKAIRSFNLGSWSDDIQVLILERGQWNWRTL